MRQPQVFQSPEPRTYHQLSACFAFCFQTKVVGFPCQINLNRQQRTIRVPSRSCSPNCGRAIRKPRPSLSRWCITSCTGWRGITRSEEHTSELQSRENLVCRLLLEKKKKKKRKVKQAKHKKKIRSLRTVGGS